MEFTAALDRCEEGGVRSGGNAMKIADACEYEAEGFAKQNFISRGWERMKFGSLVA